MKKENVQMLVEIKTKQGAVLKPTELHFWHVGAQNSPKHLHSLVPNTPFKFFTDAILGLCYHRLTDYRHVSAEQKTFLEKAYRSFDPYTELYYKSSIRVNSLRKKSREQTLLYENFEKQVTEVWEQALAGQTVSFAKLAPVLDLLADFEQQTGATLLYNFNVHFSEHFTEKLLCFYSLLFHLRSVMAVDHNAHVEDSSYESVTCDSISDYLPKADYTVNDALIYWNFKKLSLPFTGHKDKDSRVEKLLIEPLNKNFHQYSHNACQLVDQLPASFLNSLNQTELEEVLHHVQMDWLLGSESGLLFKIREELFGVISGYEKIFWPECATLKVKKASVLNLCFEVTEKDLGAEQHSA